MKREVLPPATHDFDFLWGSWRIENSRLRSRLTCSNEWEDFVAHGACRPILGGTGNVDDFVPIGESDWSGFEGGALRLFDPESERWSIYWFDNVSHRLLPPLHGAFNDGVGEFFGFDEHNGQPVQVRFRWSSDAPNRARWEQAFSIDEGQTWESNWIMSFTRLEEPQ